ncbi:MAG: type II secretion system protein M [Burkholderiaceae bacterium]
MKAGSAFEGLITRWRALAARERRLILWGSVVLLVVFVWGVLFEPAWQGRQRLRDELPALRGQVARMDALAAEVKELSSVRANAMSAAAARSELQKALDASGLASQASVDAGNDLIRVKLDGARFDGTLAWLYQVVRDTRLQVADVSIIREPDSGRVTATFALERPLAKGR